jgi:hypothetical protein
MYFKLHWLPPGPGLLQPIARMCWSKALAAMATDAVVYGPIGYGFAIVGTLVTNLSRAIGS